MINSKYVSGNMEQAANLILPELKTGDIVITLGAGSITNLGKFLVQKKVQNV